MTAAEARAALRAFGGPGNVEPCIAGRPCQAALGGGVWRLDGGRQA